MDVKGEVLLQLFNKSKLRNGTETFLEAKFFSTVKFKKLQFSAPLNNQTARATVPLSWGGCILEQKFFRQN